MSWPFEFSIVLLFRFDMLYIDIIYQIPANHTMRYRLYTRSLLMFAKFLN